MFLYHFLKSKLLNFKYFYEQINKSSFKLVQLHSILSIVTIIEKSKYYYKTIICLVDLSSTSQL